MTEFEIRGNKIISKNIYNTHVFEIVEKIPTGFFVWNIGKYMGSDEWIPLAESLHPENKPCYDVNPNTLKAIKLNPDEVKALRSAAGWGVNNKETAIKALKNSRSGYSSDHKRKEAFATIEIYKRITD